MIDAVKNRLISEGYYPVRIEQLDESNIDAYYLVTAVRYDRALRRYVPAYLIVRQVIDGMRYMEVTSHVLYSIKELDISRLVIEVDNALQNLDDLWDRLRLRRRTWRRRGD